jgi:exopolyphosphatase/guanosine-5'-triphosphate,3'-diphosphate pyrophosphatase
MPFERVKEKIQLAKGLRDGILPTDSLARGLASIERMAQRLRPVPLERLAVVGTSALRLATNRHAFIEPAERLLGVPLRILSGDEEAELIFLGVSHALASDERERLVIDVGGGSTELALGRPFALGRVSSVELGCVMLLDRCFANGAPLASAYRDARAVANEMVAAVPGVEHFAPSRSIEVIGTSGTVESVLSVLAANGWADGPITREGLRRLEDALLARRWVSEVGVPGLAPERVDIFPSGLAVVCALFDVLGIDEMQFIDASLRDGLLYDLSGRRSAEDVRARSIASWQRRFVIDHAQVERVRRAALHLLAAVGSAWELDSPAYRDLLEWGAALHEVGLSISARQHNRHGAYFVHNGDLPGFGPYERHALAFLVRGHRGSFPEFALAAFSAERARALKQLLVLLRLAVLLERTRCDEDSPVIAARADGSRLRLCLESGWLAKHALSKDELVREQQRLKSVGIDLVVDESR